MKNDLIEQYHTPPYYLNVDLKNFDLKQLQSKFDVILVTFSFLYLNIVIKFQSWDITSDILPCFHEVISLDMVSTNPSYFAWNGKNYFDF